MVGLVNGGSVTTGPTPSSFQERWNLNLMPLEDCLCLYTFVVVIFGGYAGVDGFKADVIVAVVVVMVVVFTNLALWAELV